MPQRKSISKYSKNPRNAYFLSLDLQNVRCFREKQNVDFSDNENNPRKWTIILGDNGTGKTTLLQYLVILLPIFPEIPDTQGRWYTNVRPSGLKNDERYSRSGLSEKRNSYKKILDANVSISIQDSLHKNTSKEKLTYGNNFSLVFSDFEEFRLNCFAYGASRKAGETSLSEQNEDSSYITLFDETILLINPEEWILQADYASKRESEFTEKRNQQLTTVMEVLKKILPNVDDIRIRDNEYIDKEEKFFRRLPQPIVEFHTPYGWVEAKDLSLGYRTSMAWMVDFASRMFDLYPESKNPLEEPAVVLIDEIDLHLHPKWQRELLDYLSNLFPNTQFIVTTHSPLIVQSAAARDANIVVCRREGDQVVIDQSVEAVKNWRADQILTSDLFGLETARPKETEKLLKEKVKILSKPKLTKKDEKRLAELEKEIGFLPVSENQEDNEAMEIIKKAADWIKTQAQ